MQEKELRAAVEEVRRTVGRIIRGKEETVDDLLTCVLAGGHVLLDDIPGVGKTTLSKALAKALDADFKRVQFTPDLLPADILGSSVFNPKTAEFLFHNGPVFTNIFLADEINRASPRTQSALLEAMNENQVSIEGVVRPLPDPFIVIATENPVEYFGTYPLPEAQLDRFAMQLHLGYPDQDSERAMLEDRQESDPLDAVRPCMDRTSLVQARKLARSVAIEKTVGDYLQNIILATRKHEKIRLGASPRAYLTLAACVKARAFLQGRDCVTPDDVRALAVPVLAHRMTLDLTSAPAGITTQDILHEILKNLRIPA